MSKNSPALPPRHPLDCSPPVSQDRDSFTPPPARDERADGEAGAAYDAVEADEVIEELDGLPGGIEPDDAEEVDAVPVFESTAAIEPHRPALLPVPVQAAAVAVTGFVVGLLTIVLFRRRRERRAARRGGRRPARRDRGGEEPRPGIVASRSFLVDVHLLGGRD